MNTSAVLLLVRSRLQIRTLARSAGREFGTHCYPLMRCLTFSLGLTCLVLALGCDRPSTDKYGPSSAPGKQSAQPLPTDDSAAHPWANLLKGAKFLDDAESWHVNLMQGHRIGYRHTRWQELELAGQRFVQTDINEQQSLLRFGEKVTLEIKVSQLEDAAGHILQFEYQLPLGAEISLVQGVIQKGNVLLTSAHDKAKEPELVPFPAGTRGFDALEESLATKPMVAGEQRSLQLLQLPPLSLVGTVELTAKEIEPTKLPAGEVNLLRIDEKITLPGGATIFCHLWADTSGRILKYSIPALQQETFLASREIALDTSKAFSLDLGSDMLVRLQQSWEDQDPHHKPKIVYQVKLKPESPAINLPGLFAEGLSQQVHLIDDRTATITVYAVRPDSPRQLPAKQTGPDDADLQASSLIESESPEILKLVNTATENERLHPIKAVPGGISTAWQKAVSIEKFVNGFLTQKNYSQAFSSAAEVARTREGDCTEHAVLVTALCRAAQIPARVVYGLVYVPVENAFAFHMWNEVWTGNRWVPLDATLGLGGIGAGHLKFGHSSLRDLSSLLELIPVMQSIGRLEISPVADTKN